jgi:hypothetical protein
VSAANGTAEGVGADGIVMAAGTTVTSGDGKVLLSATGESDLVLGLASAGSGGVILTAWRDILDSGVELNVQANALPMVVDSNSNQAGQIGAADSGNGDPTANAIASPTEVTTLAGRSADAIYVLESVGVTIDLTGSIGISQATFPSTTSGVTAVTH